MPTRPALVAIDTIKRTWPGVRIDSSVVCRNISGTGTRSQHSYGNALDLFGPGNQLEAIYQYFNRARADYSVKTLCYRGRGGCSTGHYDHVHIDFHPAMTGPCGQGTSTGSSGTGSNAPEEAKEPVGPWYERVMAGSTWVRMGQAIAGAVVLVLGLYLLGNDLAAKAVGAVL